MSESSRFCVACHQQVVAPPDVRDCPRCGQTLTYAQFDPTISIEPRTGEPAAAHDAHEDEDLTGQELAHYRIERFLGQGGMARVYLAKHLALRRPCAIKFLLPRTLARDSDAIEVFMDEARTAANLNHPHIVTIYTIGQDRGRHFIEMEYVPGRSLADLVGRNGPLDALEATRLMLQLSSALSVAHKQGLIHRDIKPANVMVTESRDAKLADFGLAKRLGSAHADGSCLCGTPNFMAPELFAGSPATTHSDIYAMGITYHCLLTGRLPIATQSLNDLIRFHRMGTSLALDDAEDQLPDAVRDVLGRCLHRDASSRFEDALDLHGSLRTAYGGLRSLESLLNEAFTDDPISFINRDGRFEVVISLPASRRQTVYLEIVSDADSAEEIVRVFSRCSPANADHHERALRLNSLLSHGSIGIESFEGQPYFVMLNAYPRATCDPGEIRSSVLAIARHADELERLLTGADRH